MILASEEEEEAEELGASNIPPEVNLMGLAECRDTDDDFSVLQCRDKYCINMGYPTCC